MQQFTYTIQDPMGLHARPAGLLAKAAAACACDVKLTVNGTTVDAKRIMGIMRLAAKQGMEMTIACEGADEEKAAADLQAFVAANL